MQVHEFRYNVQYSEDFYTVNYTSHNFQTFLANESCAGCTLNDTLVTINRCCKHTVQPHSSLQADS